MKTVPSLTLVLFIAACGGTAQPTTSVGDEAPAPHSDTGKTTATVPAPTSPEDSVRYVFSRDAAKVRAALLPDDFVAQHLDCPPESRLAPAAIANSIDSTMRSQGSGTFDVVGRDTTNDWKVTVEVGKPYGDCKVRKAFDTLRTQVTVHVTPISGPASDEPSDIWFIVVDGHYFQAP